MRLKLEKHMGVHLSFMNSSQREKQTQKLTNRESEKDTQTHRHRQSESALRILRIQT